jgi:hypothetical protein
MKYKIVKEFKRGEPVPADAVYISSRLHQIIETITDEFICSSYDYDIVKEEYWIDCYEVLV